MTNTTDEFQMTSTVTILPEALLDPDKALLTLRQPKLAACRAIVSLCKKSVTELQQLDQQCSEQKRNLEVRIKQISLDTENIKKDVYEKEHERNTIRNQISVQKEMVRTLSKNIPDEEELCELMAKVCSLKDGIKQIERNLRLDMKKYTKGINFYKKYLCCKVVCISEDTLMFTFDTSAENKSDARSYLKFTTKDGGRTFQYLEMRPQLKLEQQLVKKYNESGDIQVFIILFWKLLKELTSRKILSEKN